MDGFRFFPMSVKFNFDPPTFQASGDHDPDCFMLRLHSLIDDTIIENAVLMEIQHALIVLCGNHGIQGQTERKQKYEDCRNYGYYFLLHSFLPKGDPKLSLRVTKELLAFRIRFLAGCQHNYHSSTGHSHDTDDAQQHSAVIAGVGQIEAGVVDHFQQGRSIGTAVVLTHLNGIAAEAVSML